MAKEKIRIVGVDTTVLIWGDRKEGTEEELDRARWLFEKFDAERSQIVISTSVLTEYLVPNAQREHAGIVAGLSERFIIVPFDTRAASIAASLFKGALESADRTYDNWRQVLRADCCIVAAAKASGVQDFYSNDPTPIKLAKMIGMEAYGLPTMPEDMFDESMLKRSPR